ncbi:hypothetical protein [Ottowia thiooxydans]|uniref:Uncharacterized protein n=1 Tax=Ottowia thiooxydans TaxID=219182 RepID=A0ABV2Q1Y4_9BURK
MTDQPNVGTLYALPTEVIQRAVLDQLVDSRVDYLKVATFFLPGRPTNQFTLRPFGLARLLLNNEKD